ncbi:hypothetical protein ACVMAJ_002526 [Bradyrhizobium sp. USDA 4448]
MIGSCEDSLGGEGPVDGKVYLISNKRNSKVYVGITRRTTDYRPYNHVKTAEAGKGSAGSLQQAIRDFGAGAFAIKLLATAKTLAELASLEVHYIGVYNSLAPNGYNLNRGGAVQEGRQLRIVEGEEYWSLAELADAYGILRIPTKSPRRTDMKSPVDSETMSPTFPI